MVALRRLRPVLFVTAALSLVTASSAMAGPTRPLTSEPEQEIDVVPSAFDGALRTDDGRIAVLIELREPSAAVVYAQRMNGAAPNDAVAKRLAGAASALQVDRIVAEQESFAATLAAKVDAREMYRVQKAVNGLVVAISPSALPALQKVPGVKRIVPILMEHPTSSMSVPFIDAPQVWANTVGLPAGVDGAGVRIGIIDTGIDYMHGDFGGTGALADYQAESTSSAGFTTNGSFPTAKVVGGTDLAGDAYSGSNAPLPDANPMDCNGHGSHVAGTAAGFGVTAAGTTFTGPYDANDSTYSALRIAPGVAPGALLYAIRVFGCTGGTGLTVQAIDWAMDPNGDNDLSDHLDVINMSLGSDFGSVLSGSAIATDNAVLAGVIVAMSAGNAGDTFFIAGSPGIASRGIATAASVDAGEPFESLRVSSPAAIAGDYFGGTAAFGPAPSGQTADLVLAIDPTNTTPAPGCGPDPNDACCALTNAAAIAGKICVVNRGTCTFKTKALNCQNAGAIGTIVVNNAPGSPPPGMADDATIVTPITIPTEMVTLADGATIKGTMSSSPPVNGTMLSGPGGDTMASFSSRGPRRIYGSPLRLKPDISAPGLNIVSVQTGHTCTAAAGCTGLSDPSGFQAGNKTLTISGTSMASPHMAGTMALMRQIHPDWTVEELKALVMNYATHDVTQFPAGAPPRYGLARQGAGRVDDATAAVGEVIAMSADDVGLVSVTFDPDVPAGGPVTETKKVRVVNHGTMDQTFDLAFDEVVDAPGVSFSLPGGNSVLVPAASTVELDVQMTADASAMKHTRDASLFPLQGVQANYGDQPRNFLSEEGAYLTFSQGSTLKLRLPVYMAERPHSDMSAPATIVTGGNPTGSTTVPLSGVGLCTGTLAAGPTCTGSFPDDVESLVSPFELQVVSPQDPVDAPPYADIRYAGISYFQAGGSPSLTNDLVMFGVASWAPWSSLSEVAYDICVDNNNDGVYDRAIINTDPSVFVANASHNDNFVRVVQNLSTGGFSILGLGSYVNLVPPSVIDTALHLNDTMILAASPSTLGYTSTTVNSIRYKVVTCPGSNLGCARSTTGDHCTPAFGTFYDIAAGPFTYNWGAQGLDFGGDFLDEDLNGKSLPVTWNTANMTANGSVGALLLHHHNRPDTSAQVVVLDTAQRADLALTKGVDNATPAVGGNVTFTITATNQGPNNATGVVVNDFLPDGLSYVSDDGGGAYDPGTGLWTIGALANGAAATLHVTASVEISGEICNEAQVAGVVPVDTNAANDQATACVNAPRTADLTVTIGASVSTAHPGDPILYTLTVTNGGDDPAYALDTNQVFSPSLVPSGSYSNVTASQGVFSAASGIWNLASLGPGNTATLMFQISAPNMAGDLTNTVTTLATKSRHPGKTFDPNSVDNTANVIVKVLSPAAVTATKSVSGTFREGGAITYTVVLTNSSAFDQQNNAGPELTDVLPSQLTLVSASATSGTANANVGTNTATWDGVVPANGSVTVTIQATVKAGTALQTVTNQATVDYDANGDGTNEAAATSDDPSTAPAGDATSFVVVSPSTIGTHTKTVAGSLQPGGVVTYTITISNPGTAAQLDNPGDELTDVLPASLVVINANASSGAATITANTVHWNGGIAAGASVTINITAQIDTAAGGQVIANQATVFFDADGNGTNESSQLTDDPSTVTADDPTTFRVAAISAIPALGGGGLLLLGLVLGGLGVLTMRARG